MSTFNQNQSVVNIPRKLCLDDLLFLGQVKLDVLRNGKLSTPHLLSHFFLRRNAVARRRCCPPFLHDGSPPHEVPIRSSSQTKCPVSDLHTHSIPPPADKCTPLRDCCPQGFGTLLHGTPTDCAVSPSLAVLEPRVPHIIRTPPSILVLNHHSLIQIVTPWS